jgi:hypothetical protein
VRRAFWGSFGFFWWSGGKLHGAIENLVRTARAATVPLCAVQRETLDPGRAWPGGNSRSTLIQSSAIFHVFSSKTPHPPRPSRPSRTPPKECARRLNKISAFLRRPDPRSQGSGRHPQPYWKPVSLLAPIAKGLEHSTARDPGTPAATPGHSEVKPERLLQATATIHDTYA